MFASISATGETLQALQDDPRRLAHLLAPEDPAPLIAAFTPPPPPGLWGRMFGKRASPPKSPPQPLSLRDGEGERHDLEQVFGAVLTLLGRSLETDNPFGGERIGTKPYHVSHVYAVDAATVAATATQVKDLSQDDLRARHEALQETGQPLNDAESDFDTLWEEFGPFRDAWSRFAARRMGVVTFFEL